ncbi:LYR motif-containing protein 1-like protein [Leptotrombidium deliense]|uniref:LYR motif-containing protein 1-like protein n=1 Tax=Leptotrombidium deliense TaxID=299467 RepID=A0A443S2M6_9ACAR|nr:LYR motif-containing protein 1-like protein [Leptotrombidium deliense]
MCLRREVLSFCKQVLRLSRNWVAKEPANTAQERQYIRNELRQQIEVNRYLFTEEEIRSKLNEGKNRLAIAQHYGIPYPRPIYFQNGVVTKGRKVNPWNWRTMSSASML